MTTMCHDTLCVTIDLIRDGSGIPYPSTRLHDAYTLKEM